MTTQVQQVPEGWVGSLPEWVVYDTLVRVFKKVPGVDFVFQSPLMGGRMERGGVIVDFIFYNPPDLAINVQGEYWHYGLGQNVRARDQMARAQLAGQGITVIFVDEVDVLRDPVGVVGAALRYQDLSRLGRGR